MKELRFENGEVVDADRHIEFTCPACGALCLPDRFECPSCGWSFPPLKDVYGDFIDGIRDGFSADFDIEGADE